MKRLKNRKVTRKIGLVRPFLTSYFRGIFQRSNHGHKDLDLDFLACTNIKHHWLIPTTIANFFSQKHLSNMVKFTTSAIAAAFFLNNVAAFVPSSLMSRTVVPKSALKMAGDDEGVMNKYSRILTEPKSQGASQAMLYATGITEEDMGKPQVGICSVWYEGNPCNMHLLELSEYVKTGVVGSELVGYRFNTVGVSDGISMGTTGMRYSLQSRDLIADSIETTMGAQWYDGLIALPGCDKNMPGCVMAMARLNRPSIMVYGGTIRAGTQPSTNSSSINHSCLEELFVLG